MAGNCLKQRSIGILQLQFNGLLVERFGVLGGGRADERAREVAGCAVAQGEHNVIRSHLIAVMEINIVAERELDGQIVNLFVTGCKPGNQFTVHGLKQGLKNSFRADEGRVMGRSVGVDGLGLCLKRNHQVLFTNSRRSSRGLLGALSIRGSGSRLGIRLAGVGGGVRSCGVRAGDDAQKHHESQSKNK